MPKLESMPMADYRRCRKCGAELADDSADGICPACRAKGDVVDSGIAEKLAETAPHGPRFAAPSPAELAGYFPQLEIIGLIGQGGMGAVYTARQPSLDRIVAIKVLPADVGHDGAFAERFTREARALARLNHQNIVGIYDFGQAGGLYYFIMEYVDGVNLRELIEKRELTPRQALALVPQICEALQFAHDEGIVHRDIKPENILLDKRGRVKVADFGLAKLLGGNTGVATLTRVEQVMGTPLYMAPEQMQGSHSVDHRADIYSLGVVFYEMLTGELPIGRFAPPSQKVEVDVRLDQVVLRALEREPERRYQHASDVKTDVESIVVGPAPIASADSPKRATIPLPAQVRAPAIGLFMTGVLNWVTVPFGVDVIWRFVVAPNSASRPDGIVLTLLVVAPAVLGSACILFGALKMMRCQGYSIAVLGSLLAMLIIPGNIIGLPIGIWALVVLTESDVKAAFPRRVTQRRTLRQSVVFITFWVFVLGVLVPAALAVLGQLFRLRM
jgi:predicted Ser/Thr protein kinase